MNKTIEAVLDRTKRGIATRQDALILEGYIEALASLLEKAKGELDEEDSPVNIEVICTCRDGDCSSLLPEKRPK